MSLGTKRPINTKRNKTRYFIKASCKKMSRVLCKKGSPIPPLSAVAAGCPAGRSTPRRRAPRPPAAPSPSPPGRRPAPGPPRGPTPAPRPAAAPPAAASATQHCVPHHSPWLSVCHRVRERGMIWPGVSEDRYANTFLCPNLATERTHEKNTSSLCVVSSVDTRMNVTPPIIHHCTAKNAWGSKKKRNIASQNAEK